MSGLLPLLEQKDAVIKSMQHLTFKESHLFDQCNEVRVDICHHLLEQQTEILKQYDDILLKLVNLQENKEQQKDNTNKESDNNNE